MAVINLISPEQKRDINAARINVRLAHYGLLLLLLACVTCLVYGFGFWLVWRDEQAVTEKLTAQNAQSSAFASVEKEADVFRKNLTVAKRILSAETTYSSFLTTLARDMPAGAVLTSFSIGGPTAPAPGKAANSMTLDARASSYGKVLELKNRLEQSALFENVSIVSTARPDTIAGLSGLEAKYPFQATFNVTRSKPQGTPR